MAASLAAAALGAARAAGAQTITDRVAGMRDGTVRMVYAARPGSCGDGATLLRTGIGGGYRMRDGYGWSSEEDYARVCRPGPVRVVASVSDGQPTRLRVYVGPLPDREDATLDLGRVPARDAAAFLGAVIDRAEGRALDDAMVALVVADSTDPWPALLRAAQRSDRTMRVRRSASFWLAQGAAAKLGVADTGPDRSADDDVRAQAVFALSQQPRERSVPTLLTIARDGKNAVARAQALFWLGQTGDPRAIDYFAELLAPR